MKLIDFLRDSIGVIIFYFVLMLFISLLMFLDSNVRLGVGNIVYINFTGAILFITYLALDFFKRKRYYETLLLILQKDQDDIILSLPTAPNFEKKLYQDLLLKLHEEYNRKLLQFYNQKKAGEDFINYWVHEIKTPIAASRLIIENPLGKSKEQLLDIWGNELASIENYIEQALCYSRTNSFSNDYFIDELNIKLVINSIIKKLSRIFISKKIRIELIDIDFLITSDKKWISFIIEQILLNSLKYTNEGGAIKISGTEAYNKKMLIIEDNGIGIKSEDLERVFDMGFTGYNGRTSYKATGLGLYLCKSLCDKLGHNITIESEYNKFTRILLHFPNPTQYQKEVVS